MTSKPHEAGSYYVWGNKLGCFDHDVSSDGRYEVYLAGDSFTWGYAPIDRKFGQLLEEELAVDIASCGVSHTGQRHQFMKFKEIVKSLGYYPDLVIVNMYYNDIDNDFSHPHSTVIDGYLLDVVQPKVIGKDDHCVDRLDHVELRERLSRYRALELASQNGRISLPWQYVLLRPQVWSASYVLFREFLERIDKRIATRRSNQVKCSEFKPWSNYGVYDVMDELYRIEPYPNYPINSSIAERNRDAIRDWILDSKAYGYTLVFAMIDIGKPSDFSSKLKEYVEFEGGKFWSFSSYIGSSSSVEWHELRWNYDDHFNAKGNDLYAEFLAHEIRKTGLYFAPANLSK